MKQGYWSPSSPKNSQREPGVWTPFNITHDTAELFVEENSVHPFSCLRDNENGKRVLDESKLETERRHTVRWLKKHFPSEDDIARINKLEEERFGHLYSYLENISYPAAYRHVVSIGGSFPIDDTDPPGNPLEEFIGILNGAGEDVIYLTFEYTRMASPNEEFYRCVLRFDLNDFLSEMNASHLMSDVFVTHSWGRYRLLGNVSDWALIVDNYHRLPYCLYSTHEKYSDQLGRTLLKYSDGPQHIREYLPAALLPQTLLPEIGTLGFITGEP